MNAPDKIYIDDLAVVNDCATKVSLKQLPNFSEYIRKDALMAFLNERRKGLTSGDSFVAGERKMLKETIDKIESL